MNARSNTMDAECQPRRRMALKTSLALYRQIKVSVIGRKSQQTISISGDVNLIV